jgi:uncharacterized protein (DUF1499 family)
MSTPGDETNWPGQRPSPSAGSPEGATGSASSEHDTSPGLGGPSDGARPDRRWPLKAAGVVLALALVVAVTAAMAGFGSRWGFWDFRTGFSVLRWAAYAGLATTVFALPVLWLTRPGRKQPMGFFFAVLALLVSAPVFLVPLMWRARAGDVPPIHDITTDTNDPPPFQEIAPLRADAPNPVEYPGAEVAAQQRAGYPDIRPTVLDMPMGRAFERALATARAMGWEIVASDVEEGRIEATDRTFWFGFRDDVVIRLTPSGDRTIVDVRSKSRVGGSDVGTNARRIRSFLERLTA